MIDAEDTMNVFVPTEAKFFLDDEGVVRPSQRTHLVEFWARYQPIFKKVIFTGRQVEACGAAGVGAAVSETIQFRALPGKIGLLNSLQITGTLCRLLRENADAAVCLRMPSVASAVVGLECLRVGRPFGVEVVGDPATGLKQAAGSPVGFGIARRFLSWAQKILCKRAAATAYVTKKALQADYPPGAGKFTTHYSTITLIEEDFRKSSQQRVKGPILINVGNMGLVLYKGQDQLVRLIARLKTKWQGVQLILVGDGEGRSRVEKLAKDLDVLDRIRFVGHVVDRKIIHSLLDDADIFLCPSRQEGLPKALIEAMARGLPAVGSSVGGIPELLCEKMICGVNHLDSLEHCLEQLLTDELLREEQAQRNFLKAREYHLTRIRVRRDEYYQVIREKTEEYLRGHGNV